MLVEPGEPEQVFVEEEVVMVVVMMISDDEDSRRSVCGKPLCMCMPGVCVCLWASS